MKQEILSQYRDEAEFFKALSHPTRLFVLHNIKNEEVSVTELAEKVGIDISTMSKHLDLLKRHQIITGEKIKNHIYYKLNMPCIFDFLRCAKEISGCPTYCMDKSCAGLETSEKDKSEVQIP